MSLPFSLSKLVLVVWVVLIALEARVESIARRLSPDSLWEPSRREREICPISDELHWDMLHCQPRQRKIQRQSFGFYLSFIMINDKRLWLWFHSRVFVFYAMNYILSDWCMVTRFRFYDMYCCVSSHVCRCSNVLSGRIVICQSGGREASSFLWRPFHRNWGRQLVMFCHFCN